MFSNRTLLITGGTGSFGNAVLSKFLKMDIKEIRIFSRDEKKQDDMRRSYQDHRIQFYIGDVRDINSLDSAMYGVDYIFHAAALKQVPSCEFFPIEAVKTNVLGTENLLNSAINAGVKKIICLSTDKAAYPVNAMGVSKAMMEKTFIAKSRSLDPGKTLICGTRYGNVLCSRGSVVPLFIEQIKRGGAMTITDPQMTRYIMTLEEAVDLVEHAFSDAEAGDIWVQKAPSAYIGDLARALAELFEVKYQHQIIGTRHGEKKYEVLVTKEEMAKAIDLGSFFRIPSDNRSLNYEKYLETGSSDISDAVEYNSENAKMLNVSEIKDKLMETEYVRNEVELWRTNR